MIFDDIVIEVMCRGVWDFVSKDNLSCLVLVVEWEIWEVGNWVVLC